MSHRYVAPAFPFRLIAFFLLIGVSGCTSLGSRQLSVDNLSYNEAIATAEKNQMLANLVRIRYMDTPIFLNVSSVLTQYTFGGDTRIAASDGDSISNFVSGSAGLQYQERPTITFSPLAGQDFSRRLLKPIPADFFFAVSQAGWSVDLLMSIGMQRINDVENMSFGGTPKPGLIDDETLTRQFEEDQINYAKFREFLTELMSLSLGGMLEMQYRKENGEQRSYLVFDDDPSEQNRARIKKLKMDLGLTENQNEFLVTEKVAARSDREITVKTRSLLAMMSAVSRGVEVPEKHKDWVVNTGVDPESYLMTVRSSKSYPTNAFAAVPYADHWYYVANDDLKSKRVFGLLIYLFNFQAPASTQGAPLLTLPTG